MTICLRRLLFAAMWICGALPALAQAANQAPGAAPAGIAIISPAKAATLGPAQLQALPAVTVDAAFGTEHGPFKAAFSGPLLWTVLNATAAINPKAPKLLLREYALITGADGYTALVGLAEIAPWFEDKNVILATRMNGKDLGPQHLRIVVPGDKKGGRDVYDVVRIVVSLAK